MHAAGSTGWEAREDASPEVLVALYLRDALGVRDPSGVPRMLGTGLPALLGGDEHSTWWLHWWREIIEPERGGGWGVPLELVPGSRYVALPRDGARHFSDAVRPLIADAELWAEVAAAEYARAANERRAAHGLDGLWRVVKDRESALGHPAAPFRLRIEVVPVGAPGLWWIGEHAVAVSDRLRDDLPAYQEALRPVIARLA